MYFECLPHSLLLYSIKLQFASFECSVSAIKRIRMGGGIREVRLGACSFFLQQGIDKFSQCDLLIAIGALYALLLFLSCGRGVNIERVNHFLISAAYP